MNKTFWSILTFFFLTIIPGLSAGDEELIQRTTNSAETSMRVVKYGIDNELPDKNDLVTAKFLLKAAEDCLRGIEQMKGNSATTTLELNGEEPMSLDAIRKNYCKPAYDVVAPLLKGAIAKDNEVYKGLSPERIEVMKVHGLRVYTIYGHGKKKLSSNEELQKSDVWYVWDEDKGFLQPHWWMATIHWKGIKYEKTLQKGAGTEPSPGLFK